MIVTVSLSVTQKLYRIGLIWLLLAALPGCATVFYQSTPPGKLSGKLVVEWYGPDKFLIVPDPIDPLTFVRADGEVIRPELMYNDSSHIPRSLWVNKHYSPWGYTPAFMIHDWLYEMQHCRIEGYQRYDSDAAAEVLAEVVRTLMEDPLYGGPNPLNLYALYWSVKTPAAQQLWQTGVCDSPLQVPDRSLFEFPLARYVIQF